MKEKYKNMDLYVAIPSKLDIENENKMIQNPNDITIIEKTKEYTFIDVFNNEEILVFCQDELKYENKYIGVFRDDCVNLSGYMYSIKTDYLQNLNEYMEVLRSINTEYTQEELEKIKKFLKKETKNLNYTKTKKITKGKRRIIKK